MFSGNSFGPTPEPKLSAGIPFPRPLISPARLSVVSFSPSAGLCVGGGGFALCRIFSCPFGVALGEKKAVVSMMVAAVVDCF